MVSENDLNSEFEKFEKSENSSSVPPSPEEQNPPHNSRYPYHAHLIAEKEKQNCGRTGPTSPEGKAISSRNALRHGCCAKTLILEGEKLEEWIKLCARWEAAYPSEHPLLQDFILKTAQAEWRRIRVLNNFEDFVASHAMTMDTYDPETRKLYDLKHRYNVAAERTFQREFRMLDHFFKTNCEPKKAEKPKEKEPEPEPEDDQPVHDPNKHVYRIYNAETGEYIICGENPPVIYPPEPGWVPRPIIPGQYYPDHPSNWKYPGNPKHRFTKDKLKWSTEPQS